MTTNFSSIGDFSTSANANTTIDSNNIAENCPMGTVNNVSRSLAAAMVGYAKTVDATGGDTYTASLAPVPDNLQTGMTYHVNFTAANTSTNSTLKFNSFASATVVRMDGSALNVGDLNGPASLRFDGTHLQLMGASKIAAANVTGAMTSTGTITDGNLVAYSGTSGSLLKGAGFTLAGALRSYLSGLTLSPDATNPNTEIDIAAGVAADSTNATLISLSGFGKSTTGSWSSGSGSTIGGMGNGLTVSSATWYHVILANNGGAPDIYFDTSVTGANRPSGITDPLVRRIGSFETDASAHIIGFVQQGDEFRRKASILDINANSPGTTATLATLSVPPGVSVVSMCNWDMTDSDTVTQNWLYVSDPAANDEAPSETGAPLMSLGAVLAASGFDSRVGNYLQVRTNTASQVRYRPAQSSANVTVRAATLGYIDTRGRFN